MTIEAALQNPSEQFLFGNSATIYLGGTIDKDAAQRLENFIAVNHIPPESSVILNSPGGDLFGGMELGKVIRKYNLTTDIGKPSTEPVEVLNYQPGGCYSACTLAYLGGRFRYLKAGSHFGIHRFSFTKQQPNEGDVAQIASASIVNYLRLMNVDTDLFSLSTTAAPTEIFEPPVEELKALGIVNDGFLKPIWTVESNSGIVYLKGERDTVYGINKFMLICERGHKLVLHAIFDAKNRDEQLLAFPAHSLVIDGKEAPISPAFKKVANGWFNSEYALTAKQVASIRRAKSVGVIVQGGYGAPVFFGFDAMPIGDGAEKLAGLMNVCGVSLK